MTKARDIATSEVVTGEIGSTIQAHDADLDSIAALDKADGNVIVGDGTNWVAESGATARTSLGLGTAATTNSTDYATAAQGALADSALQSIAADSVGASEINVTGNGTSGQVLASDGDGTMTWTDLPAGGGGLSGIQKFTTPGTWTKPDSVTTVKVTVVGGGGNGGNGTGISAGGGGGSGGYSRSILPVTGPVAITIGGPQGTSSFGALLTAGGGARGNNAGPVNVAGTGGAAGASGGNLFDMRAGQGGNGNSQMPSGIGGHGGALAIATNPTPSPTGPTPSQSLYGMISGGASLPGQPIPGKPGTLGGGAGGGHGNNSGGSTAGGTGGSGFVIVEF